MISGHDRYSDGYSFGVSFCGKETCFIIISQSHRVVLLAAEGRIRLRNECTMTKEFLRVEFTWRRWESDS